MRAQYFASFSLLLILLGYKSPSVLSCSPLQSRISRCRGCARSSRLGRRTWPMRSEYYQYWPIRARHYLAALRLCWVLVKVENSWKVALHLSGSLIIFSKMFSPPTSLQTSTGSWYTSTPGTEDMMSRKLLLPSKYLIKLSVFLYPRYIIFSRYSFFKDVFENPICLLYPKDSLYPRCFLYPIYMFSRPYVCFLYPRYTQILLQCST